MPWTIALCGILLAGRVNGQNGPLLYALPMVLAVGCLIGLVNGFGIAMLGISLIVMTLAVNGILQGIALLYSQGTPAGFSAPLMRWFMTSKSGLVTPVVVFVVLFAIAAVILHRRTPFGWRVYALGNGERVAALSGIAVNRTILLVFMLSSFCAALVGGTTRIIIFGLVVPAAVVALRERNN